LREALDLKNDIIPWVTSGYNGAIASGQTICGAVYGATAAIGFACAERMAERNETSRQARERATRMTHEFYRRFLKEFKRTDCRSLTGCDFSRPEDAMRYQRNQVWTDTCDRYLELAIRTCYDLEQEDNQTVEKQDNTYQVTSKVTGDSQQVVATSAREACERLGWAREDCDVERVTED